MREKVESISQQVLEICRDEEKPYGKYKDTLMQLLFELERTNIVSLEELLTLLQLHRELREIKNRKASYFEEELTRKTIVNLPYRIRMADEEIPEDVLEALSPEPSGQIRLALAMSMALYQYAIEVIESKKDKTKRYTKRIKESLRLLDELNQFYLLPDIKDIFMDRIHDADKDVQFFALVGLENYYAYQNADKITEAEQDAFRQIINTTPVREIAFTCCQILINAKKMDELEAVITMDHWKDRHWYNR